MRFEQYLTEKTFNIGADVDLVWKELIKPSYDLFKKGKYDEFMKFIKKQRYITSAQLKSKQAKMAHELNPVTIYFVHDRDGNFYRPSDGVIHFSYHPDVLDLMKRYNYDADELKRQVGVSFERFNNEISEDALKGTIYHELSHWLNDTLHNRNISNLINKSKGDLSVIKQGHSNVNMTFYEIDAQIHALKQLKRRHNKEWESFDWSDIIKMKPSFGPVFTAATSGKEYYNFMKNLTKRMHREKLLTKNLSKYPSETEMMLLLRRI